MSNFANLEEKIVLLREHGYLKNVAAADFSSLTAILVIARYSVRKRVFFENGNAFKAFIKHVSINEDSHNNLQR